MDLAVLNLIEKGVMEKKDFNRTKTYSLRLRPTGAKKVTEEVNAWLNKKVKYQKRNVLWSYVILLKARELAQYLVGKKKTIDFLNPNYETERHDSDDVRKKILEISYADWKKQGFSKGTLHQLKQKANGDKPFTLNKHIQERLSQWDKLIEKTNC